MKAKRFFILTGMSGAGKTLALKILEDWGVFCIDNLPPALVGKLHELSQKSEKDLHDLAVTIDIRGGNFFNDIFAELQKIEETGQTYEIIFLESEDEVLVNRYKESRRRHPLLQEGTILEAIKKERLLLEELRGKANWLIDTSKLSKEQLKKKLQTIVLLDNKDSQMTVTVMSFGYKYGLPLDADLAMDVRFLPNPHYVPTLKPLTGLEQSVQDYIAKWPVTQKFIAKFFDLTHYLLPQYQVEGKSHLLIAIGCTGGQHRSVFLTEKLADSLIAKGYDVNVIHRDRGQITR